MVVLDDEKSELTINGDKITLIGLADPSFKADYLIGDEEAITESQLQRLCDGNDGYSILLSHRPEFFDVYADSAVGLVLSGHAHGGIVRLPFTDGLVGPKHELFPDFTSGVYTQGDTAMVVSRGFGGPVRFLNNPHIAVTVLKAA